MRKNKLFALLTSGIMAVSALTVISVSADAEEYALGDIDMDGVITEHDATILYRILDEETGVIEPGYRYSVYDNVAFKEIAKPLSEEQKALADMNGDGIIDYTDADIILEKSEYMLGDVNMDGQLTVDDVTVILDEYAHVAAGFEQKFSQVQENIIDFHSCNGDEHHRKICMDNASDTMNLYVWRAAGLTEEQIKAINRFGNGYSFEHNYFYGRYTDEQVTIQ